MKRKLFVLANSVWHADDFLHDRNTNPMCVDLYLYDSEEKAKEQAKNVSCDDDIYNDGTIYMASLEESQILELSGFETIDDFEEALKEPYSTQSYHKNYGEDEKTAVAEYIVDNSEDEWPVDCANYDFDKTLEGAIIVCWSWQTHVGYARKCEALRYGYSDDTESLLTKEDCCYRTQCDVVMTADEVDSCADLAEALMDKLHDSSWKWTNPEFVDSLINDLA